MNSAWYDASFRPMKGNPDSGIHEFFGFGIRNPGFGIRNPALGIRNPANDWNPESKLLKILSRLN